MVKEKNRFPNLGELNLEIAHYELEALRQRGKALIVVSTTGTSGMLSR